MTKQRQRAESNVKPRDHWNEIMSFVERVLYNGHHNDDADSFNISLCKECNIWTECDWCTHAPTEILWEYEGIDFPRYFLFWKWLILSWVMHSDTVGGVGNISGHREYIRALLISGWSGYDALIACYSSALIHLSSILEPFPATHLLGNGHSWHIW